MQKLILGIGIPASGKSTFLEAFAALYGHEYLCVDQVRSELFSIDRDDPVASTDNNKTIAIWDEIRLRTKTFLAQNKSVIVDATFAKAELRKEFALIGQSLQSQVVGVFLDTDPEVAWNRNLLRDSRVPRHVFDERIAQLKEEPPSVDDGFDVIFIISASEIVVEKKKNTRIFKKKLEQ